MSAALDSAVAKFENRGRLLEGVPAASCPQAEAALDELYASLGRLQVAVKSQQADYIGLRVSEALKATADVELLQAPGLAFLLPKEYRELPRLVGRAVVEFTVERGDGSLAFLDPKGGLATSAVIQITLDGYSAPISAGNFLNNVLTGRYDGRALQVSRTAVVAPTPQAGQDLAPIPLEILPLGEFEPVYRIPLDVQGGELPVLPLSIDGAVAMTHIAGNDSFLSGDEWFMMKFDKQSAGLAGLAFDEGQFGVFGYVTKGLADMNALKNGDVIVKATVVSGADKLIKPRTAV